jgi:tetratricopeptide (TPR) repeat protein
MKTTASYKRAVAAIRSFRQRHKYAEALASLEALLNQWPDQPVLLLLRAELIQLQDEQGPRLDDAAIALKRAVALDDGNADAWLELGHFQFAIKDDARAAEKSFVQAIGASSATLIAALVGRAAALEELGRNSEAFDCLSAARYLQSAAATKNGAPVGEADLLGRWESLVGNA